MNRTRIGALGAVSVAVAMLISGCGGGSSAESNSDVAGDILAMPKIDDSDGLVIAGEQVADAKLLKAAREDTLVWYTASGSQSAELTAARFEDETGVEVEMTRMPSSKLYERVLSESGAGQLSAGVVTITDPVLAQNFAAKDVFVKYEVPVFEQLQGMDDIVWDGGKYYTSYYSAYAFAYNDKAVNGDDVPETWSDLLDEKWKGKLGVVHAGAGGTVQGLADFQQEVLGKDYWDGLAAQDPRIYDTTSVQLEALARGEVEVVTTGFNSTYGAEQSGSPIELVVPEKGVSGTFNMQGLTTPGTKSPAAKLFMNWTMSKSGQQFAAAQGFVGARTDIEQVPTGDYQLPKADDPKFHVYGPKEARQQGNAIVARWSDTFEG